MTMMAAAVRLVPRRLWPTLRSSARVCPTRFLSSASAGEVELADRCDLHIVSSPYPPIEEDLYPPVAEFVTSNWAPKGYLHDKVAIRDGSTGLTRSFAEYRDITFSVAAALRYDLGLNEASTVALFSPNHVDYLPVSLAVSLCGSKLAPINPLYTVNEIGTILDRSRTSVLIAHSSKADVALEAAKNSKSVKHVIIMTDEDNDSVPEGTVSLASMKKHEKSFGETVHAVHQNVEYHPYLLPYSSGTTGLPKGVSLSHSNLIANLLQMEAVEDMSFPSNHKLISPLPFFHIYGFLVSMLYCAWKGQEVITMSGRFDLESFCQLVEEHRPERSHLVPPIILGLAKHPMVDKFDMSSLQMIISAAAPMSADIEKGVVDRLGCDVKQAWGMSELSPIGTLNSDFNFKSGSVGPLVSSTFGKIIDQEGNTLGANESGELLIKGPQVMMGYLDDPEKTSECLSKTRWLSTGDVAHYDEDGFFYITDRLKELIKVRGFQVAPAELEALLLTNEHVSDAAVIQVPDEESGELPRAYVVLKDEKASCKVTEDEIHEWVKERVAPFKRLDGGVVFVESIPKSASGKILRRVLRDEAHVAQRE